MEVCECFNRVSDWSVILQFLTALLEYVDLKSAMTSHDVILEHILLIYIL